MSSAASEEGQKSSNPVARKLVSRYREILPNPTVGVGKQLQADTVADEPHLLSKCGTGNPKLGEVANRMARKST
ncbi:hypothetical protein OS493_023311 [Desmophyllum pertusum]|uniref:Uncharacterized protein n=1 Tax=Desmophyllum pertusum TaxID=174260 RepID=A0A9X0CE24_9CNID|nr:hypothetical protein OS493_023311 [Desmophyllum pertusum]